MRYSPRLTAIAGAGVLATSMAAGPAQASNHDSKTWKVDPGTGTISEAIDKAHAGDTLVLRDGTYYDSVIISKELTIRGAGWSDTVVKPPDSSSSPCNDASSTQGFCVVTEHDLTSSTPDFDHPVKDVKISDLRITGFSNGVIAFNTKDLWVSDVRADHNTEYGIAAFASKHQTFQDNWTSYSDEAGLYMGDSPDAHGVLKDNKSDHNGIGVFMRDSTYLTAEGNHATDNCAGILALNSGGEAAPWDSPAGNYTIEDNTVRNNNKACPAAEGHPAFSGHGIALAGVHDTVVKGNEVTGNDSSATSDLPKGGIVVFSTAFLGGADPTDNTVRDNEAHKNMPADIVWDKTGSGNEVKDNDCHLAIPDNLGWCKD